jgi:hypothetical protein
MKFIGENAEEAKQVLRLLNKQTTCEEEIISYSGRGMYGKECLAVVVRPYMIADLFFEMGKYVGEHDIDLPHLTHVDMDNMGYDKVIYWKAYQVEVEEEVQS